MQMTLYPFEMPRTNEPIIGTKTTQYNAADLKKLKSQLNRHVIAKVARCTPASLQLLSQDQNQCHAGYLCTISIARTLFRALEC